MLVSVDERTVSSDYGRGRCRRRNSDAVSDRVGNDGKLVGGVSACGGGNMVGGDTILEGISYDSCGGEACLMECDGNAVIFFGVYPARKAALA